MWCAMKKSNKRIAIALGALVVLLAAVAILLKNTGGGDVANIYQNGLLIRSVDLSQVTESYSFTVTDNDGHENLITVEPGRIRVTSANCPDQICVNSGWLDSGVEPIVCLPAKLVIRLEESGGTEYESSGTVTDIDGVAG